MAAAAAINMSLDDIITQNKSGGKKGASTVGPDGLPRAARPSRDIARGGSRRGGSFRGGRSAPYSTTGGAGASRAAAARFDNSKLSVSNLNPNVTQQDIHELFSTIGPVKSAVLNYDQHGKSKGTGTVIFRNGQDAKRAVTEFNNRQFDGRPMRIEMILSATSVANLEASVIPPSRGGISRGGPLGRRGRGAARGGRGPKGPTKTPEELAAQLDAEMDKYMQDETMGDA